MSAAPGLVEGAQPARTPEERCRDFLTSEAMLQSLFSARALGIPDATAAAIADALMQRVPEPWRPELRGPLEAALPEALDVLVTAGFVTRTATAIEGSGGVEISYAVPSEMLARVITVGVEQILWPPPSPPQATTSDHDLERQRIAHALLLATVGLEVRWLDRGKLETPGTAEPLVTLLLGYAPPSSALAVAHDDLQATGILDASCASVARPRLAPAFWHFVRMMAALDPT